LTNASPYSNRRDTILITPMPWRAQQRMKVQA
jgi:hypothetical protein